MMRELIWRKSSYSSSDGDQCVELASLENQVAVRDSKNPNGPILVVSPVVLRDAIRAMDK